MNHIKNQQSDDHFSEFCDENGYKIEEICSKGSYGVVCSAIDAQTHEKVGVKKITNMFHDLADATRILREIKILRLLQHPDIVEIKNIILPSRAKEFTDIHVVFERTESDLHSIIKSDEDIAPYHQRMLLYQILRGLKYMHSANVFHRDLNPMNIVANSDYKLKICDFGRARVSFNDSPLSHCWTDYGKSRWWYRAPELCIFFFSEDYSSYVNDVVGYLVE